MTTAPACVAFAVMSLAALGPASAQDYPTRPIKIVVGFAAGGGTDLAARVIAQPLQEILGQPVVVENRHSAGGIVGGDQVAKGAKDGYTILMMSNAHAVTPAMYKALPYDPIKDFQMVSLVGTAGLVMIATPEFPANDIKGAIALLKADPGKYNYGSAGVGTTQHFSAELFNQMAGVKAAHIPYRSTPAVVAGLLSKDTNYSFELIQVVTGQIRAGTLKAIAVTSPGALSDARRGADRRRVRPAGLRRDKLVWAVDGGRDAAADRRSAQQGGEGGARPPRRAKADRGPWRAAQGVDA